MDLKKVADTLVKLQKEDLKLRAKLIKQNFLFDGYHPEMEALHIKNAEILESIINQIGYPTIKKVGTQANEACWFVIQHAISKPEFMKKCLDLIEIEVENGNENKLHYAYLKDRILVFQNQPQYYGTQFDWDENNLMNIVAVDDYELVNYRRKSLGLNSIEEQTQVMRNNAKLEGHLPPKDAENRKHQSDLWRKKVGWI